MYINGVYINPLHAAGVFIIILFIYIQIQYYYKVTPDENANIYELTQELPKKQFDRVCDTDRIPFVFAFFETPAILRFMAATDFTTCSTVPIHIRQGTGAASAAAGFKTVPFIRGMELMSGAVGPAPAPIPNVVTERNSELLKALHISAFLKRRDAYLRPALCQYIDYDLLMGAPGSATPLRYEINQRTFFMVTEGVAYIRLVHPATAATEFRPNEEADIDNRLMEYRSQANLWSTRTAQRIPCMHLTVKAGQTVYIPPFWWYTIQFIQGPGTRVLRFSYRSIINSLVMAPYFISHKMYAFSDGGAADADVAPVTKTSVGGLPSAKSSLKKKSRRRNVTFAAGSDDAPVPASMAGTPAIPPPLPSITPAASPAPGMTSTTLASGDEGVPAAAPVSDAAAATADDTTPLEGTPPPTTDTTSLFAPPAPQMHPSGFVIPLHAPMPDPIPQPVEPPQNAKSPNLARLLKQMEEMETID